MDKIKITWTMEYEPKIEDYPGAVTVEDCMKIDMENIDIYDMLDSGVTKFEVIKNG